MPKSAPGFTRIFNGKQYGLYAQKHFKRDAISIKNNLKQSGWRVRVIKQQRKRGLWLVYYRKKN